MEIKKSTSVEEQLAILKSRNVIIDDDYAAMHFLQSVGYYHFSAYLLSFKKNDRTYIPVEFTTVMRIYNFDRVMRFILFQVIEEIEINLRAGISNYHANKYGAEDYMLPDHFNSKHDHEKYISLIERCKSDHSNSPIVRHHNSKYGGHFPIWAIFELFTVGMLSHFYIDLETADRKAIARSCCGTSVSNLDSWFRCFADLRNTCAHYSRLYNSTFSAIPRRANESDSPPDRRLFSQIQMLKYLFPDFDRWNTLIIPLIKDCIDSFSGYIDLDLIGFPEKWDIILIRNKNNC